MIPDTTDIFLKSLKSLALFEFLPTAAMLGKVRGWFGVTKDSDQNVECMTDGTCHEEMSTSDELAMIILAGIFIALLCLILLILACLVKKCPKVNGCYQSLKRKLAWGIPIRYLLLGTLKT